MKSSALSFLDRSVSRFPRFFSSSSHHAVFPFAPISACVSTCVRASFEKQAVASIILFNIPASQPASQLASSSYLLYIINIVRSLPPSLSNKRRERARSQKSKKWDGTERAAVASIFLKGKLARFLRCCCCCPTDQPIRNFRAPISGYQQTHYLVRNWRETDFKTLKLWKGPSGTFVAAGVLLFTIYNANTYIHNNMPKNLNEGKHLPEFFALHISIFSRPGCCARLVDISDLSSF